MREILSIMDALPVAKRFLIENLDYEECQMFESRYTDETYRFIYKGKDYYQRDVTIAVTIDFFYATISADVVLLKDDLMKYIDQE